MCKADKICVSENYSLIELLKIDRSLNCTRSFIILLFYRIHNALYYRHLNFACKLWGGVKTIVYLCLGLDAQISYKAKIGHHICLPHSAMGVVVSSKALLGNHITIYHQVTIGINENKPEEERRVEIMDNCYLSVGCKIINCKVSENCKIAPNAVVYRDLASNSMCYSFNEVKALKK